MANTILLKRSAVAGKVPTTSDVPLGSLAVNTYDGKLYTKKSVSGSESIVEIGALADGSVTSAKIADGTIVNGDISGSAAIADTKLATISTAGKVSNSATTATNANTASAIVARDGSGNFSAGTISAALSGNASTATTLQTARTINGTSFNGSANITTSKWGTARSITIGNTTKSVDGSANVSWSLAEIGASGGATLSGGTITGNYTNTSTGYFQVSTGTTAQRPTGANGYLRYNTTLGCLESFVQGAWQVIANTALDYGLITSASDTTFDYGALV
jgi:hypothetical protein